MAWRRGRAYGQDLRDRVLGADGSIAQVAERYAVSESYVVRARSKLRRLGEVCAGAQRNHLLPKLSGLETALAAQVAQGPDQTLLQLCAWAQREHSVRVGVTTMHKGTGAAGAEL